MKKSIIGLLLLTILTLDVSASVKSEVEANRFQRNNVILTDTFTEIMWERNYPSRTKKFYKAKEYCNNLTLDTYNDWRLPTRTELQNTFKLRSTFFLREENLYRKYYAHSFWTGTEDSADPTSHYTLYLGLADKGKMFTDDTEWNHTYVRCVRSKKFNSQKKLKKHMQYMKIKLIEKLSKNYLNNLKNKNDSESYENFLEQYPNFIYFEEVKALLSQLYQKNMNIVKSDNTINSYKKFITQNQNAPQVKEALKNSYILIKQQNNITGYEWFIKNYPSAKDTRESIKKIHKLTYQKANEINTLSSYNTFIISYPYASQIKEAMKNSSVLESKKYDDINKDDERKARLLAVKIKKMTIQAKKSSNDIGYQIVINRMSNLLTSKYEETDASLRYYESKEFTDFASKFETTMNDIKTVLNKINTNTEDLSKYTMEMIKVARDGFSSANADRDMASYKLEEHEKWEKFMHFRDQGYN